MKNKLAILAVVILTIAFVGVDGFAADPTEAKSFPASSYIPRIGGAFRGRFELDTHSGAGRFNVRNARLTLTENVGRYFTAFAQIDLCDRGKFHVWDVWMRVNAGNGFSVQAGQFRMPFGADSFLGPATYYFANRSFIGKYLDNYRAVGLQAAWALPAVPLRLSTGIFNPGTIDSHTSWTHSYSYALRVEYSPGPWKFTTGVMSHKPDAVRLTLTNVATRWSQNGLTVDGEYMLRHYAGNAHAMTHGWLLFGDYTHPMSGTIFNQWSAQARFDGMTALSTAKGTDNTTIITDYPLTNRITIGGTVSHIATKKLQAHLRLNYEKYLYGHNHIELRPGTTDCLLTELVLIF